MYNQETVRRQSWDLLDSFDVGLFYWKLRIEGCNPVIRDGALHMQLNEDSAAVRSIGQWAARHDPSGAARLEYARLAWEARSPLTEFVLLG